MTDDELPPLPECLTDPFRGTDYGVYSPQQMRDYGKACAKAAIERCAKVAEGPLGLNDITARIGGGIAAVIRGLRWK